MAAPGTTCASAAARSPSRGNRWRKWTSWWNSNASCWRRNGRITDIGDMGDMPARRTIDASGLYIIPTKAFAKNKPAWFQLSRDPEGRDIVWTLAGDVDPAQPGPAW